MSEPAVDLIVPTVPGREESLQRCLESFAGAYENLIVTTIVDSPTCGEGWMTGLETAEAPYVALVADDLELVSDRWPECCIEVVDRGALPCPRVYTPEGIVESQGGDMNAVGHILPRHRRNGSPCDFTTVPFMSRQQAERIDMLPIQYSCDVWVSYRGRQLGYETELCHGFDLIHYQEQAGRGAGMSQGERDAMDTAAMFAKLEEHDA